MPCKNDYNYYYKCSFKTDDGARKCEEERRNCTEYSGDDESVCTSLRAKDPNKRCVFDVTKSQKCYEEYKSCQIYNETVKDKTRAACQNIKLLEPNRKCVYIEEEDKCEETLNYTTCEEYTGTDKTTCESIISPTTHSKCILEKDSICKEKERELLCKEAFNEEDCIYYAKPSESGKRCVWSGSCYEVYTRCEDFTENNITTTTCPNLYLYNGQRCYSDLGRCRSKQKICSEARNANECKEDGEICCYVEVRDPENNNQKLRFCVSSPSHLVKDDIKDEVKLYTGYILDDLKCNKSKYLINDIMKILVFIIFMLL